MKLISIEQAAKQTRTHVLFWRLRIIRNEIPFFNWGTKVLIPDESVDEIMRRVVVVQHKTQPKTGLDSRGS